MLFPSWVLLNSEGEGKQTCGDISLCQVLPGLNADEALARLTVPAQQPPVWQAGPAAPASFAKTFQDPAAVGGESEPVPDPLGQTNLPLVLGEGLGSLSVAV